jgi:UV DNA damage endonuclease
MNKIGLCCISLNMKELGYKFQTMTYKRFSSLSREEGLSILGDRILNNMTTTAKIIEYCGNNNLTYRLSSDLFPLITFDKANIYLENLPNYDDIEYEFDYIADMIYKHQVRISLHPSEYNSLASLSKDVTDKTITELNFYSSFMDRIGCPADYRSPMNLHIHNKDGDHESIIARFVNSFNLLDPNCRSRLVIENDDKVNCWSVRELVNIFHAKTNIPITFDYLHHACHPNGLTEEEAIRACHATWGDYTPLFHYSESRPGNNPRAHSDYANNNFNTYDLDFDLDFELKMKDHAISQYLEKVVGV